MKVSDYIAQLQKFDPDAEAYILDGCAGGVSALRAPETGSAAHAAGRVTFSAMP